MPPRSTITIDGKVAFGVAQEREGEGELLDHRLVVLWRVHAYPRDSRPPPLELFIHPGVADQLYVIPEVQNDLS